MTRLPLTTSDFSSMTPSFLRLFPALALLLAGCIPPLDAWTMPESYKRYQTNPSGTSLAEKGEKVHVNERAPDYHQSERALATLTIDTDTKVAELVKVITPMAMCWPYLLVVGKGGHISTLSF